MRISGAFPSDYLKAADLQGKQVKVVMDKVDMEDIGSEQKPVLYFQGTEKGMVLNKTNAMAIQAAYGDDTDDWSGREIVLFEAMVAFQGRTVPAIRVRAATPPLRGGKPPQPAKKGAKDASEDEMNDSIPW